MEYSGGANRDLGGRFALGLGELLVGKGGSCSLAGHAGRSGWGVLSGRWGSFMRWVPLAVSV